MAFGYHLMLDLYECDKNAVGSIHECYAFLDKLPEIIHTSKQAPPYIFYTDEKQYPDKAGLSGWVPLVESGISIHTLTPTNFVSIDIYTCHHLDKPLIEKIKEYTFGIFLPRETEERFLIRGERYPLIKIGNDPGKVVKEISFEKFSILRLLRIEDKIQRKSLWQFYIKYFQNPAQYAEIQDVYDEESFYMALLDQDYFKFLLRYDKEYVGLCLITTNLDKAKIAYVNPQRLESLYPKYKDRIFYVTFIGVIPSYQKTRAFYLLVSEIIKFIDKSEGICGFDFAREGDIHLSSMILRTIKIMRSRGEIKKDAVYESIGIQEYGVVKGL